MAFIFVPGTGCAAPMTGLATFARRIVVRAAVATALLASLPGAAPVGDLTVSVDNLRSAKGDLLLCVAAQPSDFPDCRSDPRSVKRAVPASEPVVRFEGLAQGNYAIAVIHDENGNDRLDRFAGIPREGFGFSRNPPLGFGPPKFGAARFALGSDAATQQVRLRYLL